MKHLVVTTILILSVTIGLSQDFFPKNSITVETGIGDRGVLGLTYSRNFNTSELLQFSIGGGAGLGIAFDNASFGFPAAEPSGHFYTKIELWLGSSKNKLIIGLQPKFVAREYGSFFFDGHSYSTNLYAGYQFMDFGGFTFQTRMGIGHYLDLEVYNKSTILPSFGFSFGYSF